MGIFTGVLSFILSAVFTFSLLAGELRYRLGGTNKINLGIASGIEYISVSVWLVSSIIVFISSVTVVIISWKRIGAANKDSQTANTTLDDSLA